MFRTSKAYLEHAQMNDQQGPNGLFSAFKDRRHSLLANMKDAWQEKVDKVKEHNDTVQERKKERKLEGKAPLKSMAKKTLPKRKEGESFRKLPVLVSERMGGRDMLLAVACSHETFRDRHSHEKNSMNSVADSAIKGVVDMTDTMTDIGAIPEVDMSHRMLRQLVFHFIASLFVPRVQSPEHLSSEELEKVEDALKTHNTRNNRYVQEHHSSIPSHSPTLARI